MTTAPLSLPTDTQPQIPFIKWKKSSRQNGSADFEYNKIGIPRPDCVVFLDMPVEISQKLMISRYNGDEGKKDVHEANVEFLQKCRKSALYTAEKQGWCVVQCSDGKNPLPIEQIHNKIVDIVKKEIYA
jgi:dTMP kinase